MIAGFYSPMPPARTGVADYSAALVEAMRREGEVGLNADGDVNLYHLGNNALHLQCYRRAIEQPGVVVLHDAVLHHFLLGTLNREQYIDEFVFNYGGWHAGQAAALWDGRARSGTDPEYFRYPMLKRQMQTARAVVVHNPAAGRMAAEHGGKRIVEIPHLFVPPPKPADYDIVRLRASFGAGLRTCVFGVFGHLRESKRLTSVVRAFENVVASGADAKLLVAGDFVSSDLARAMAPALDGEGIVRVGHTRESDFWRYAASVDACVSLRFPQAGETSGIAIRLMGIGKPVIVTAGDETAAFPEDACLRVPADVTEIDMLSEYMMWLAQSPADGRAIGDRAARHIAAHHAPELAARAYWNVLECVS